MKSYTNDPRLPVVAKTLVAFRSHASQVDSNYARQQQFYDNRAIEILVELDRFAMGLIPTYKQLLAASQTNKVKPSLRLRAAHERRAT